MTRMDRRLYWALHPEEGVCASLCPSTTMQHVLGCWVSTPMSWAKPLQPQTGCSPFSSDWRKLGLGLCL